MNTDFAVTVNRLMRDDALHDIPNFGNVNLLHVTVCHAPLLPIYCRERSIDTGVGWVRGKVSRFSMSADVEKTAREVESTLRDILADAV